MDRLKILIKNLMQSAFFKSPFYLKYNQLIIPAAVLVAALLILVLVTVPQFFKLFETFKTIDELNTRKAFYQKKTAELQALNLPDLRQDLETALIALPVEKDIPGIAGELLVALSGSGMSLNAISFSSGGSESDKVQEYTLRMDVTGSEANLKNFLERVKLAPRLITLSTIDIGRSTNGVLTASVGFATLYQALPESIGSVDEDVPKISPSDLQVLSDIEAKVRALPKVTQTEASASAVGKLNPFQ